MFSNLLDDKPHHFDLFVSYKSHDANIVRILAEQLLAQGVKVWFAEYLILLSQREEFQNFIDDGIATSEYAICVTNERYSKSKHCQKEIDQILAEFDAANIVEIKVPNEPHHYEEKFYAKGIKSKEFKKDTIGELIEFIGGTFKLNLLPIQFEALEKTDIHDFDYHGLRFKINLAGWEIEKGSESYEDSKVDDVRMFVASRTCGKLAIRADLVVGKSKNLSGMSISNLTKLDDEYEYFDAALKLFKLYSSGAMGGWEQILLGVHVIRLNNASHPAFTSHDVKRPAWWRQYCIVCTDPRTKNDIEFSFHFYVDSSEATFNDFCRHAYIMDHLVLSLDVY